MGSSTHRPPPRTVRSMNYWLIKSEPSKYPFAQLVADKGTRWDGVRNFEARNNLRAMKKGDFALFYHSNEGKEIVGIAKVARAAYQDPTTTEDFSAVDFTPLRSLAEAVTLAAVRSMPKLKNMVLLKKGRLSVSPVTEAEFHAILTVGKTTL